MADTTMFDDRVLRAFSRTVFGHDHRLALMLVVARHQGPFTVSELREAIGAKNSSSIQKPFEVLTFSGLIEGSGLTPSRERTYVRVPSAIWAYAEEAHARLIGQGSLLGFRSEPLVAPGD